MTTSVLIVGAGIGGLTLAHALQQRGISFRVIEKARDLRAVGAGISLGINAMNVLDGLGVGTRVRTRGEVLRGGSITDERGRPLQTLDFAPFAHYGSAVALHRADLQAALIEGVSDHVQLGTTVQSLNQGDGQVTVHFSDGREEEYGVVVAADGLHSAVRTEVFGPQPLRYAGYTSWRFVVPRSGGDLQPTELWGRGRRLGLVPIGGGQVYGFATLNAREGASDPVAGRARRLRERFANFGGAAPAVLAQLPEDEAIIHTDIREVVLPRWVRGRVTLLGDAAHGMTPNLGQGAGMSIEDAAVLAEVLGLGAEVQTALTVYEARRKGRVSEIQKQSRWLGRAGQVQVSVLVALRNAVLRATPRQVAQRNLGKVLTGDAVVQLR